MLRVDLSCLTADCVVLLPLGMHTLERLGNHSNRYITISIVDLNVYYMRAHYLGVVTRDSVLVDLCFILSNATPPNAFFFQASSYLQA